MKCIFLLLLVLISCNFTSATHHNRHHHKRDDLNLEELDKWLASQLPGEDGEPVKISLNFVEDDSPQPQPKSSNSKEAADAKAASSKVTAKIKVTDTKSDSNEPKWQKFSISGKEDSGKDDHEPPKTAVFRVPLLNNDQKQASTTKLPPTKIKIKMKNDTEKDAANQNPGTLAFKHKVKADNLKFTITDTKPIPPGQNVYEPKNFKPHEIHQADKVNMSGKYFFHDKVNNKVYGEYAHIRGYWVWRKQETLNFLGEKLDIHNKVVLDAVIGTGVVFLMTIFLAAIGYFQYEAGGRQRITVVKPQCNANYPYLLNIYSGYNKDSVRGNVRFALQGQWGITDQLLLTPDNDPTYQMNPWLFRSNESDAFIIYAPGELGDLILCELELESELSEHWFVKYVTVTDIGRSNTWYFPCHREFQTQDGSFDRYVLMKELRGGHRLFHDNLSNVFYSQHLWLSIFTSPNNVHKSSISMRSLLICALVAGLMAGNMFVYVRPIVDYGMKRGMPQLGEVLVRCLMINVCIGMISLVLELAVETIEGRRNQLEERAYSFVMRNNMIESGYGNMRPGHNNNPQLPASPYNHIPSTPPYGRNTPSPPPGPVMTNFGFGRNNSNSMNNSNSISLENPINPRFDKRVSWLDLVRSKIGPKRANAAADALPLARSDSESDMEDWVSPHYEYVAATASHAYNPSGVPPPPVPPVLGSTSTPQNTPDFATSCVGKNTQSQQYESAVRNGTNWNQNANTSSSIQDLIELSPIENITNNNRNSQYSNGPRNDDNQLSFDEAWLSKLRDVLLECDLNLVLHNDELVLQMSENCEPVETPNDKILKESLKELLDMCQNLAQVTMLQAVISNLKEFGILDQQFELEDVESTYALVQNNQSENELIAIWDALWEKEFKGKKNIVVTTEKNDMNILDEDSVKKFATNLGTKVYELAKNSVVHNSEESLLDLQKSLKNFIKGVVPNTPEIDDNNIPILNSTSQRRHSDSSLVAPTPTYFDSFVTNSDSNLMNEKRNGPNGDGLERASITDIHMQMGLRPLTRKLSDAVVCTAYECGLERLEMEAMRLARGSVSARQQLVRELASRYHVPVEEDINTFEHHKETLLTRKRSCMILDKIRPEYCGRINNSNLRQIASATLQSVLSADVDGRIRQSVKDVLRGELQDFTEEVIENLYFVVKAKIETEFNKQNKAQAFKQEKISDFSSDDDEVRESIIPALTEHIVKLIEQEAETLETIDNDLLVVAYGGQFVETVMTNAILQTNVHLCQNVQQLSTQPHKEISSFKLEEDAMNTSENNNSINACNWKLEWSGMLEGLLRDTHHELEKVLKDKHQSSSCPLCHPHILQQLTMKLLGMSASKFLVQQVLVGAIECLPKLTSDLRVARLREDVLGVGRVLLDDDTDLTVEEQNELLSSVVQDLGEKVLAQASQHAAEELLKLLLLEAPDAMKNLQTSVARRLDFENPKECELKLKNSLESIASEINLNMNSNGSHSPVEWEERDLSDLAAELHEIRSLILSSYKPPEVQPAGAVHPGAPVTPRPVLQRPLSPPPQMDSIIRRRIFYDEDNRNAHNHLIYDEGNRNGHNAAHSQYGSNQTSVNDRVRSVSKAGGPNQMLQQNRIEHKHLAPSKKPSNMPMVEKFCCDCGQRFMKKVDDPTTICESCYRKLDETNKLQNEDYDYDEGAPMIGTIILFILLMVIAIACFVSVIRYGVGMHESLADQWALAVAVAILQHMFILEPLKVIMLTYHMSYTERRIYS